MSTINLKFIKTLEYDGKVRRVWDDDPKGFGICISKNSMSFIIQYRDNSGRQKLYTIGRVGTYTPDQARAIAKKKLVEIRDGQDPLAERQENKKAMTVGQLCDWYIVDGNTHKKQSTRNYDDAATKHHIKPLIGNIPIKDISRGIIEKFVRDIELGTKIQKKQKSENPRGYIAVRGGVSAATSTLGVLGCVFQFAIKHELLDRNPAHGIKRPPSNTREVFLNYDEMCAFGKLLSNKFVQATHKTAVDAIKLMLLTGCRKSEILTLKWDYIQWENQLFKFPDTKTGPQMRPFGIGALNLLRELEKARTDSPYVFPATKESKAGHLVALYKMMCMIMTTRDDDGNIIFAKAGLSPHALRHSFSTLSAKMGNPDFITGALVGHSSKGRIITSRYIHTTDKDLIAAANAVSLKIEQALTNV